MMPQKRHQKTPQVRRHYFCGAKASTPSPQPAKRSRQEAKELLERKARPAQHFPANDPGGGVAKEGTVKCSTRNLRRSFKAA